MTDKYREFVAEAEELLDEASAFLLEMQETIPTPDPDIVNSLFRVMHTLKGMAGLFGFQAFSDISHHLESILDLIRLGKAEINTDMTSLVFNQMDFLKNMLDSIGNRKEIDAGAVESSLAEIDSFMSGLQEISPVGMPIPFPGRYRHLLKVLSEYEEHRLRANIRDGKSIFLINASFKLEEFDVLLKDMVEGIRLIGEVISTMPVSEGVASGSIGFNILVASPAELDKIKESSQGDVVAIIDAKRSVTGEVSPEAEKSLKSLSATVRVEISHVDTILDTISDLSLSRQAVGNIWKEFVQEHGNTPLAIDLYRVAQSMERKLSHLQSQVLQVRMVPLRQIFSRLARIVKRHQAAAGKAISLELHGEDTEMDKYVAEEVIDPLMHLVRNAIDHGIESGTERVEAGKPAEGNLEIRAFQKGNNVIISVKDDGRGIDPEIVRAKAVQRGLITESDTLSRRETLELIFLPGFSTAAEVSETSGRGVGLDVVKDRMSFLGGAMEIAGEKGSGTVFTLTLPITLSMIRALLVRVGEDIFAVPLSSMSETFVAEKDDLQVVDGGLVYNFRGEMMPLFSLGDLLYSHFNERERYFIVISGHGDRRIGFMVDEFLGQQEVVIKPLGAYFDGVKGYAGASEIGRHKVILILDTETLVSEALSKVRKVAG